VEGRLLLHVVVAQASAVLEVLAREDEPLLFGRDALLVLNLSLDALDGVSVLDAEGDGLAGEGSHEDLHCHVNDYVLALLVALFKHRCFSFLM
jgi:hypothetical protein